MQRRGPCKPFPACGRKAGRRGRAPVPTGRQLLQAEWVRGMAAELGLGTGSCGVSGLVGPQAVLPEPTYILRNPVGGSAFPLTPWPGEGGKMGLQGLQGDRPATVTWSPPSRLLGPLLRGTTNDHNLWACMAHAAPRALGVAILTRPQALLFPCSSSPCYCVGISPSKPYPLEVPVTLFGQSVNCY